MTLALMNQDLSRGRRGERTVGTGIANQLLRDKMFVLVLFYHFHIGRVALEAAIRSHALDDVTSRDPNFRNILSLKMINGEKTSGEIGVARILMYQQLQRRGESVKAVKALEATMTVVFDDVIHELLHSFDPPETVAASQNGWEIFLVR